MSAIGIHEPRPRGAGRARRRGAAAGFTLIELLVVSIVVAIVAAAATLAIGSGSERELANASERFHALLGHACAEAELSGREIGARVAADGYAFQRLDGDVWRDLGRDGELRPRRWPAGLHVELARDGRRLALAEDDGDAAAPQLVCFSSGELTPFTLSLALGETPVRYRVRGVDDGTLTLDRLDAAAPGPR
ncbi:MAG TPA: type II secretion system minor pseudopilin GspH [Dokdonella sp.]